MLGVGLLLTIGTGLFVASEFALVNLDRADLEARQAAGESRLSLTISALKITSTHLSSAQLGITLTTLLAGYTLEPAISGYLEILDTAPEITGAKSMAECGGLLYLGQSLAGPDGKSWPMAGVLPGEGYRTKGLVRFGYAALTAEEDSLLFRKGEQIPAHEFHHWDTTAPGAALTAQKPDGRAWRCGYVSESLYAAFPHLYFAGAPQLAERFAGAAAAYRKENHHADV